MTKSVAVVTFFVILLVVLTLGAGLVKRQSGERRTGEARLALEQIVSGLEAPNGITSADDAPGKLLITLQSRSIIV